MKRSIFYSLSLLCTLAVTPDPLGADAPSFPAKTSNEPASLEALVSEVLQNNPELNFYRAEIGAAKGERRSAGVWPNPELSTEAGRKRVSVGGLADEGVAWAVSVQQTFEWPGRIPLRKAIANRQIQLAELGLSRFQAELAARTRTLAYNLSAAHEKAAAAREVADRFEELREVLVQRDPAGLSPFLELRIMEATDLIMKRKAAEAELEAKTALLELNQLRGAPWTEPMGVQPSRLLFSSLPDVEVLLAAARTNNFEILSRQVELEQQGLRVSLAKNERYPAVTVGPFFSHERAGERESVAGVGVSIPLPLWNRNSGAITTAQARQNQAATSLWVVQREIERQVAEAFAIYETKLREMALWRPNSVEEFRSAADLADRHYRLGAVAIATYVELQKGYLEAMEGLLETKREALEAGHRLQLLTGVDFNPVEAVEPQEKQ